MENKTPGKVKWELKDGDKRLMISWQAKKGETKIPVPQVEAKIILLMLKMKVEQAEVRFNLMNGNPRNIEFVDNEAALKAGREVARQKEIQERNAEKWAQTGEVVLEKPAPDKKIINTNYQKEFHNPYNFIPAIPRGNISGELSDREPIGHDKFYPDHLSGKLTVRMTVKTPIVVLDTARMSLNAKDPKHKMFPVRIGTDNKPLINPTAVKGMIRSAYEVITNSRLSVFTKHQERLAFRAEVGEGVFVIPARIEDEKVFLYTGTSEPTDSGKPHDGQSVYAAWLGKYKRHGKNYHGLDKHGREVWAYITKWQHDRFRFWNVVELRDSDLPQPTDFPFDNNRTNSNWRRAEKAGQQKGQWVKGFVCETNENIKNKHDERLFFVPWGELPIEAKVNNFERLKQEWKRLIENYQEVHSDGKGGLEKPPRDVPVWSRQIKNGKNETKLETNTLCYAKVKKNDSGEFEVLELYPVMISRRLHEVSPASLLDDSLKPAAGIDELSPADRVFGWVGKGISKNGNYRGQIRFGEVECVTKNIGDCIQEFNDLPLNILGQPKPQQGRFYVAKDKNGNAQNTSENNENAGYKEGRGLRGRKVYPHHSHIEGKDFWFQNPSVNFTEQGDDWGKEFTNSKNKKYFREYLRPRNYNPDTKQIGQQRDSQNRSIKGWVKPETEFEFDIHFTNLSEVELGALVWLLSLNVDKENKYFHRFGGGKPLGFGSVKLEIKDESDIRSGEALKEFYSSLDEAAEGEEEGKPDKTAIAKLAADFENLLKTTYPTILESFKVSCKGFEDCLPIHYPRKDNKPNAEGKSFEWFVANNSSDGFRIPLPDLVKDSGLPLAPKAEKKDNFGGAGR